MIIYGKKYLKILKDKDINLLVLTNHQKNYIEEYLKITKPVTVAINSLEVKKETSGINLNPTEQSILYGGRVSIEKRVREMLAAGQALPPEFARKEVAEILMAYYQELA